MKVSDAGVALIKEFEGFPNGGRPYHDMVRVAHKLGYEFIQPYKSGSERHHVVCVKSPIRTLEHWNVISENRGSP